MYSLHLLRLRRHPTLLGFRTISSRGTDPDSALWRSRLPPSCRRRDAPAAAAQSSWANMPPRHASYEVWAPRGKIRWRTSGGSAYWNSAGVNATSPSVEYERTEDVGTPVLCFPLRAYSIIPLSSPSCGSSCQPPWLPSLRRSRAFQARRALALAIWRLWPPMRRRVR